MLFTSEAFGLQGCIFISNQLRKNERNRKSHIYCMQRWYHKLLCLLFTRVFEIHVQRHKACCHLSFTGKLICANKVTGGKHFDGQGRIQLKVTWGKNYLLLTRMIFWFFFLIVAQVLWCTASQMANLPPKMLALGAIRLVTGRRHWIKIALRAVDYFNKTYAVISKVRSSALN